MSFIAKTKLNFQWNRQPEKRLELKKRDKNTILLTTCKLVKVTQQLPLGLLDCNTSLLFPHE